MYICGFASLYQLLSERLLSATGKTKYTMISMVSGTVRFRVAGFIPDTKTLKEIISIGIPTSINMCVFSILALGMNSILIGFSALAPAVYIVYVRLQAFFIVPTNGINNANITIISYDYGKKSRVRIWETLKDSMMANIAITVISMLIFLIVPGFLLGLFNASDEMLEIGIPAMRILFVTFPLAGASILMTGFLQTIGVGGTAQSSHSHRLYSCLSPHGFCPAPGS